MDRDKFLHLLAVARGDEPADLILRNGHVVNVYTSEIILSDVVIAGDVIAAVGTGYQGVDILDLEGQYVTPGLIDTHVHIESSMCTPSQFARAVIPHGVTTVIADPHEIANVAGVEGIDYMLKASDNIGLSVFINLPSCVPATHMGTAGASLSAGDLLPFVEHPRVLGLAEFMNVPGAVLGLPGALEKLLAFYGTIIDGHAPGFSGQWLQAYIASGPSTDHESTNVTEAIEKARLGMYILARQATGAKNVAAIVPGINSGNSRRFAFSTDDRDAHDLVTEGSIDHNIRIAIRAGVDPITAIQMATLNGAEVYNLQDRGATAPGKRADLIISESLDDFKASRVYIAGKLMAENGQMITQWPEYNLQAQSILHSVHTNSSSINLAVAAKTGKIRVIDIIPDQLITGELETQPAVKDGLVISEIDRDIIKLAVIERHKNTGNVGVGFVKGLGIQHGAIAGSIGHDCHNITVAGVNDSDMLFALRVIEKLEGGLVAVANGKLLGSVPLPIGGLMSDLGVVEVQNQVKLLLEIVKDMGSTLHDPYMHLGFLALEVIPKLKLTDQGLVDVELFDFVPLWVSEPSH